MNNYINTIYSKEKRPFTDYPGRLCQYLFNRFNMEKGNRILDIGCGRGDFAKEFKGLGMDVFGIDREFSGSEELKGINFKLLDL